VTQRLDTQTVVDGRYKVLNRIGSGGMAEVYCAEDLQLGRNVALKVLHPRFAEDQEFVERFRREASSAAGLQHQHVVSVYDRGEWDGTYYIAMEYMHGRSLKNVIQEEAPLHPARAIDLTMQVLRAARFAHRRGVIHRDLKPHNVIVDDSGTSPHAKVTDFGIARAGASDMTETGSIMGTAQYLSPEQAQGHAVSATSDLYSVGIVLYELLTGRVPFEGESAVTIALKQVNEHPVPPSAFNPAVTPELEAVVMRALEKDPARRFPDAQAFMDALEHARQTLGEQATTVVAPPTALEPVVPVAPVNGDAPPPEPLVAEEEAERRRWAWWLIALLVVVAAIIAAALLLRDNRSDAPPRVAVPEVVGTDLQSARVRLRRAGLRFDTVRRNAPRKKGTVIGQDPPASQRVPKGTAVTLTVSDGPGTATVPAVQGLTRAKARARLRKRGFKVRTRSEPSDSITAGRAVRTSPPAGATVRKGKRVTLLLSSGPVQVTVPGVQGQSFSEASLALQNAGFKVARTDQQTSSQDPETVLGQSPSAGTSVDKGSTVTLTVATAPPQPPAPPPPPKVQVPDIMGETQDVAVQRLSSEGFAVNIQHRDVDSPEGDGVVIDQDPSGGSAREGSTVTITVGTFNPSLVPDAGSGSGGTGGSGSGDGTGGTGSGDGTSGASGGGAPAPGSGTAVPPATTPPTP
jgi:eukaryotic-like serine/threonine-protein kinase